MSLSLNSKSKEKERKNSSWTNRIQQYILQREEKTEVASAELQTFYTQVSRRSLTSPLFIFVKVKNLFNTKICL